MQNYKSLSFLFDLVPRTKKIMRMFNSFKSFKIKLLITAWYGLMNEERHTIPESANNLETSPILRMFSVRSSGLKPRFELRPCLMLSPSKVYVEIRRVFTKYSSKANDRVVLPEHDKPVNQTVQPF
ncbi:Met14p [Brachionus plicatilis]|uniref:Met14p n=1 Tax=Brachionus plicatilis TaxID=10195 RepID=A0A3M7S7Y9_BRAPC|nr:Met14p [Brachionus plicatilis]